MKGLDRGGAESLLVLSSSFRNPDLMPLEVAHLSPHRTELVDALTDTGATVTCLVRSSLLDLRWLWRLRRAITGAAVVHSHSPVPAVAARLVSRTIRRSDRPRLVTTEHNVWDSHHRLTRLAEQVTFGLDDAHVAVSDAVRRSLPEPLQARVEVVVAGVDLAAIRAEADRDSARRAMGVADDEILVGTIANLRPQKGYRDLLRAASEVTTSNSQVQFVAIGQGPDLTELTDIHRSCGLGNRFRFLGFRPDAARLLSGFDIFCLASHHEGLPVALMEALALGVPVVATRAGGIPELVQDQQQGRLVEVGDWRALAAALSAEAADDTTRKAHAEEAAAVGDRLSVESSVRRIEKIHAQLAGVPL